MSDCLLTPREVAERLKVTHKQARALIRKMNHVDLGGGVVRISEDSLTSFIKAATTWKATSTEDLDHYSIGASTQTHGDSPSSIAPEPTTMQKQRKSLLSLAAPTEIKPVQPRTRPRPERKR